MRKYLLSTLLCLLVSFAGKLAAQNCIISNVVISDIKNSTINGKCEVIFDLQFDLQGNSGNKYAAVYIYSGTDLFQITPKFYGNNGQTVPNATQINALNSSATAANILSVFQINTDVSATISRPSYFNQNVQSVNVFQPNLAYTTTALPGSNNNRFTFSNVKVIIPDCSQSLDLKIDVGASNASSFNNFGCEPRPSSFVPNAPVLTGLKGCGEPRNFTFSANIPTASTVTFTARDASTNAILAPAAPFLYTGKGAPAGGLLITTYENITLDASALSNASFGQFPYFSNGSTSLNSIMLDIKIGGLPNANSLEIENTCTTPLPVTLVSFEAKRNKEKVALTWVTATEINNSGFDIQRKTGNSEWKSIAFMFSQANGGNSNSQLTYTYADNNTDKGVSQYRLRQVDNDRRSSFSAIRSVKGETQSTQNLLFPNPSFDGKANLVFEDKNTARNIIVSDMAGRMIKQYRNVTSSSLQIDNLQSGVYTVQITDLSSIETTVEKLIIMKR